MALNKIKTKAPSTGFDLTAISGALDDQAVRRKERQAAELASVAQDNAIKARARNEATAINDQSQQSADVTRQSQLEVLGGIHGQIEKANMAMKLADSDNPLDRLNLYFLQQSDPSYTREGNLNRMDYLKSAADQLGGIEAISQQGFADDLNHTKAMMAMGMEANADQLKLIQLSELQGQELIDAEVSAQQTRLGTLQNQNSIQQQALVNLTDDQVTKATEQAQANNGTVNVGGIDISLAMLQDRGKSIADRRYNERVRDANEGDVRLAGMTMEQAQELEKEAAGSKKRVAMLDGVAVPLGKIQDRIFGLNSQGVQEVQQQALMTSIQEDVLGKAQQKVINTMLVPELTTLIASGGVDPQGRRFDIVKLREARDQKSNDNMLAAQQSALVNTLQSPASPMVEAHQRIQTIQTNIQPNSPLAGTLQAASRDIKHAAVLASHTDNAEDMKVGVALLQAANENINNGLAQEAKRLSDGDKDLEIAYAHQLLGQPIPADVIREQVTSRAQKGNPIGRWLTGANNAAYVNAYQSELARLTGPGNKDEAGNSIPPMDKEPAKAAATEAAMNKVMNNIAGPMSDQIMASQVLTPGHPLYGTSPTEFAVMVKNADDIGAANYQKSAQVDEKTMAALRLGQLSNNDFKLAQNAALYAALERKKPGLGDQYIQWWNSDARSTMVNQFLTNKTNQVKGDFTQLSELSLIAPQLQDAFGLEASLMQKGQEVVNKGALAAEHSAFLAFGNNPQSKQLFLMEQTPNLTSQEKQIGMQQIIQPLLDIATQSGMSQQQASLEVEAGLRNMQPEQLQPAARVVLRKMLAGRDASVKTLDDFIAASNLGGGSFGGLGGAGLVTQANSTNEMNRAAGSYSWFQELNKSGVGPAVPRMNAGQR